VVRIGRNKSSLISIHNFFLSSNLTPLLGIPVVDIDGHKIGKVKLLHRYPDIHELKSIEVSYGLIRSKVLPKSEIWGVGEKIILRMTKKEFKNFE
jgi:sporulation protein YlmC with PRC-barrel domain